MLQIEADEQSSPDVGVVVRLHDVLPPVVQVAIAEQEACASELQVMLVVGLDGVRNEDRAGFVQLAPPAFTAVVCANLNCLIDFRVSVGLMLAFVPAKEPLTLN